MCPNGCGQMREKRSGVGQLTIVGYVCQRCGYRCGSAPKHPAQNWNPDKRYQAAYAYASGYGE